MNLTYLELDHNRASFDDLEGQDKTDFLNRLTLSWMFHDHALEGVVLVPEAIERALSGKPVRNYSDGVVADSIRRMRSVIEHLLVSAERGVELDLDFIKDIHVRLSAPKDEAGGRYRRRNTSPGVYNLEIVPAGSISYYFRKFLETYENELKTYHPIRTAAMAHHEFMQVFPFETKSGIVGRLLMNYILLLNGYPPAVIHAMDRHHYFAALDGHKTDLVPVLVDAVKSTIGAADAFSRQQRLTKKKATKVAL